MPIDSSGEMVTRVSARNILRCDAITFVLKAGPEVLRMDSKSAFVYGQVRRALQSGRYAPGQRIDPARLAAEFNTSPTPVRFALYRMVGEGMVADYARDGLHVPLLNEVALRNLYDWMERLLLMACDIGEVPTFQKVEKPESVTAEGDLVKLTWQLFDAIARATAHEPLHHAVKRANDRLAPIRRAKQELLEHTGEELSQLNRHWQRRDMPAVKSALRDYHERRKQLVPCIVALLSERSDRLH
ncbi:MAG: GntR family transcriptional regulator [Rhodanobacter thiooxydans]|nr:GntR family transcriptional regulator [Rhodanobacter thiooxydans]MCW0202657.1 GntR family transcriptional regulator [Rhodanobacter thiooxydans]